MAATKSGNSVVLGAGAVGVLFAELLSGVGQVTAVDLVPPHSSLTHLAADACAPSEELRAALAVADYVVVALPEDVALAAIRACAPLLAPGALLVDTLSVKRAVADLMTTVAAERGVEALSLNPMFAPSLGFAGNPVAVVDIVSGPKAQRLREIMIAIGARPVSVTADDHDRLSAIMQAATHAAILAFGSVVTRSAEPELVLALAPPPHRTMLAMLARIAAGAPEVYWDIQAGNQDAGAARTALADALSELDRTVAHGDRQGFADQLAATNRWFGADGDGLRRLCAQLFSTPLEDHD